jgi:hypothetical protein
MRPAAARVDSHPASATPVCLPRAAPVTTHRPDLRSLLRSRDVLLVLVWAVAFGHEVSQGEKKQQQLHYAAGDIVLVGRPYVANDDGGSGKGVEGFGYVTGERKCHVEDGGRCFGHCSHGKTGCPSWSRKLSTWYVLLKTRGSRSVEVSVQAGSKRHCPQNARRRG